MGNSGVRSNNFINNIKQLYITFFSDDTINENSLDYYANSQSKSTKEDIENAKIAEQLKKSLEYIEVSEKMLSQKAPLKKTKTEKVSDKNSTIKKSRLQKQIVEKQQDNTIKSSILDNSSSKQKEIEERD